MLPTNTTCHIPCPTGCHGKSQRDPRVRGCHRLIGCLEYMFEKLMPSEQGSHKLLVTDLLVQVSTKSVNRIGIGVTNQFLGVTSAHMKILIINSSPPPPTPTPTPPPHPHPPPPTHPPTHPPHPHPPPTHPPTPALTKRPAFRRRQFQTHYHVWKVLYFNSNFTKVCFEMSNWQFCNTGSGNALVPDMRQAITGTDADPVYRRI